MAGAFSPAMVRATISRSRRVSASAPVAYRAVRGRAGVPPEAQHVLVERLGVAEHLAAGVDAHAGVMDLQDLDRHGLPPRS